MKRFYSFIMLIVLGAVFSLDAHRRRHHHHGSALRTHLKCLRDHTHTPTDCARHHEERISEKGWGEVEGSGKGMSRAFGESRRSGAL